MEVIADESRIDPSRLTEDAKLTDLDISSIDLVSAIFSIEEKFGVSVEPEDISRDGTLGDLIDLVMDRARQ